MTPPHALREPLPIDDALPELLQVLAHGSCAVLQAPPGAGKTTRVPLALLDASWLGAHRLVMLEPRRIAARAAARRMALALNEPVGETVGYRVRGDTRIGPRTRVEVVTEGVLTRMLQADSALDGIGCVIFDEFHERSLHADLGLALTLQSQSLVRPALRLLIMSATLDGTAVSALLGNAPVVTSRGRAFPVAIRHLPRRDDQRLEMAVALAISSAMRDEPGSLLAFLPGAAEIRRTQGLLAQLALPHEVQVMPLFGDLTPALQDAAIAPAAAGQRKIVLATSIAETSLTIEGIRVVVDSGVSRVPRFSPRTGMSRLETVRVSRASADQRAGRAGRTSPGVAYRLWSALDDAHLLPRSTPEMLDADLTALALDLALEGIVDPRALKWLDIPPAAALAHARDLLQLLGALDAACRVTSHGHAMSQLALHPRLAHMLVRGAELDGGATACAVAALLDERDVLRRDATLRDADLTTRVHLLASRAPHDDVGIERDLLQRVRERMQRLRREVGVPSGAPIDASATGWLLALAYPDRVAERRGASSHYLMRNGVGVALGEGDGLTGSSFLVVADLDGRLPHARIYLAASLDEPALRRVLGDQVVSEEIVRWDADAGAIVARRRERLGALVLRDTALRDVDDHRVARVLLEAIRTEQGVALAWPPAARALRQRVAFARRLDDRFPDLGDDALRGTMEHWLLPRLHGLRRASELARLDLVAVIAECMTWEQRRDLDRLAPTHVVVPTGSRIPVDYSEVEAPAISVRLQELFGLATTPAVGDGRVPLVLRLLSPAHRPVQVTRDLAGFWRTSYFAVRKDLRGRYPKHAWPEDPLTAVPTRRTKGRA